MEKKLPFFSVFVWVLSSALPLFSSAEGFKAKYIGEGGRYQHPGGGASDALETGARQEAGHGTFGPLPGAREPELEDAAPRSAPAASRVSAPAAMEAVARFPRRFRQAEHPAVVPNVSERAKSDPRRYSLWEGLSAPLSLPGAQVKDRAADQVMALGRKDYDTHILGKAAPEVRGRRGFADRTELGLKAWSPGGVEKAGEVFVAFDLDLKSDPEQYRDAVAGLQVSAQFRPDPRFQTRIDRRRERASVWGWLPSDKIAAAMQVPSVLKMELQSGAQPPGMERGSVTQILVGIRITEDLARALEDLSADAGFSWRKTVGAQKIPGSDQSVLVVAGEIPVRNISRLMARADVVKIAPSPDAGGPARPRADPGPEGLRGFLSFAWSRYPVFFIASLLMLIPSLGMITRLASVFIPYR